MDNHLANRLLEHVGHKIEVAYYGNRENPHSVTVECDDCKEVLLDAIEPEE